MKDIKNYPLEMVIHAEAVLRDDGIVKPLDQWPHDYLMRLKELIEAEIERRS